MYNIIFTIVWITVSIIYILSFILSLIVSYCKKSSLNFFYCYTTVAIFILFIFLLSRFKILPKDLYYNLNGVSVIFHFSFLSSFIFKQINFKRKKILKFIYLIVILLLIQLIISDFTLKKGFPYLLTSLILVFISLFYYLELLNKIPIVNLLKDSTFWVVTGIFIGMGINIPGYAIGIIYLKQTVSKEMVLLISSIIMASYGIMHLFFIKAFICSLQHHKA